MNVHKRTSLAVIITYFKYCGQEVSVCSAFISHIKEDLHLTSLWWSSPWCLASVSLPPAIAHCHWQVVTSCVCPATLTQITSPFRSQPHAARESDKHPPPVTLSPFPEEEPWAMPELGESRGGVICFLCSLCAALNQVALFPGSTERSGLHHS